MIDNPQSSPDMEKSFQHSPDNKVDHLTPDSPNTLPTQEKPGWLSRIPGIGKLIHREALQAVADMDKPKTSLDQPTETKMPALNENADARSTLEDIVDKHIPVKNQANTQTSTENGGNEHSLSSEKTDTPVEIGKSRNEIIVTGPNNRKVQLGDNMRLSVYYDAESRNLEATIVTKSDTGVINEPIRLYEDIFATDESQLKNMENLSPKLEPLYVAFPGLVQLGATPEDLMTVLDFISTNYFSHGEEIDKLDKSIPATTEIAASNEYGTAWKLRIPGNRQVVINDNSTAPFIKINLLDATNNRYIESSAAISRNKFDGEGHITDEQRLALSDSIAGLTEMGLDPIDVMTILDGLGNNKGLKIEDGYLFTADRETLAAEKAKRAKENSSEEENDEATNEQ